MDKRTFIEKIRCLDLTTYVETYRIKKNKIIYCILEEKMKLGLVQVYFEKMDQYVKLPEYAHPGDAGMDICSNVDIDIAPMQTVLVPTGLKLNVPLGYELQIRPKSGISLYTPLRIADTPATIDAGYNGEIGIVVTNLSIYGKERFTLDNKSNKFGIYEVKKYNKIAQIILAKTECIELIENTRNGKGFGSSGI